VKQEETGNKELAKELKRQSELNKLSTEKN
jgi:hypothetical protein